MNLLAVANCNRLLFVSYEIDTPLNERDERLLMMALLFHPNRADKIGPGFKGIRVNPDDKFSDYLELFKRS